MTSRRPTTAQLLRYPLVFGGVLAALITVYKFRKSYFKDELEAVRQKNYEEGVRQHKAMDQAKEKAAGEIMSKSKEK